MPNTHDAHALSATQRVIDRHDAFMAITYGRNPIVMDRGLGCELWDAEGKRYLDLFAGFGGPILGHCHPELVRVATEQAHKLWHVGNLFHTEPQTLLAQAISEHGFGGRSFFGHSGADANEAAIKLARLYGKANPGKTTSSTGRFKIITTTSSFHGRTFGAMVATGQERVRKGFEPLLPGFSYVPFNDLAAVEKAIDDETVAVMVEPIQGEGGIHVPADGYLPGLRKLCDGRDLLLICDEVWTGCGRTGKWFAHQLWGIEPDIMTLAKGVGGGLPVGVMCARPSVADHFDYRRHGGAIHGSTLGGNCIATAVAAKIFDVIERDNLLAHAQRMGAKITNRLGVFAQGRPFIKRVRGRGLFIGVELDPSAGGAWFKNAGDVVKKCLERGLIINGTQNVVLRLAPAMIVTEAQLDEGLATLEAVLAG